MIHIPNALWQVEGGPGHALSICFLHYMRWVVAAQKIERALVRFREELLRFRRAQFEAGDRTAALIPTHVFRGMLTKLFSTNSSFRKISDNSTCGLWAVVRV